MIPNSRYTHLQHRANLLQEARERSTTTHPRYALDTHRALSELYLDAHFQPDERITHQDIHNLPLMIEAENARNPGLNLVYCATPGQLLDHLAWIMHTPHMDDSYRGRAIVRVNENALHHAAADIHYRSGEPISVIMPDSFLVAAHFAPDIEMQMAQRGLACYFAADGTTVQKSCNDCVVFSLSFALKLHDHQDVFDRLHQRQIDNPNYRWSVRHDGLPAAFYKHSHSQTLLQNAVDADPELARKVINKKGETLLARHARFIGQFYGSRHIDTKQYSNSIDHKRLTFIDRATAYLECQTRNPLVTSATKK